MSKYSYIDIHSHVNFSEFDNDRAQVIKEADSKGILIINIGTDLETSKQVVELAEKYKNCYAIVGLHPTNDKEEFDTDAFKKLAVHSKVVGIGECGLDFFRKPFSIEKQQKNFRAQIELAIACKKPLMIHARDSYTEILTILDEYLTLPDIQLKGNVHFFAGSVEDGIEFLARGFTLSYTGVITFADQYIPLVQATPLESIMSETDCPFVSPEPMRGQRNSPLNIPIIITRMAELKGIAPSEMAIQVMKNAERMFGISVETSK